MRKKRNIVIVLSLLAAFLITGCGSMTPLTDEEENIIAVYSAHIVSKYNKLSDTGLASVPPQTEEDATSEIDSQETDESSSGTTEDPTTTPEDTSTDAQTDEEEPADTEESADTKEPATQEPEEDYVSLSEAMGIPNIQVDYVNYSVEDSLTESTYFSMNATTGKQFLVLNFTVQNTSQQPAECNIIGSGPKFKVTINESTKAVSQATLLLNDMSTYTGDIEAGSAKNLLLVFEVNADELSKIDALSMQVTMNGTTSTVKLQ